jgi:threonine dehydratase
MPPLRGNVQPKAAMTHPIPTPDSIRAAHDRIAPHVHRTPVMESSAFGPRLSFKLENTQVTGSFKARGAFNTLLSRPVPAGGVVAASGGNHGAAVAHAATTLGHPAHIFVPEYAGPAKIGLIRSTGAQLTVVPGVYADAAAAAEAEAARSGAMQIHPYDAEATIEGQGTLFKEWDDQGLDADTVLIAVGGGGLISGAMAWWAGRRRVVAVEPVLAPTLHAALEHGPDHAVQVSGIAANALGASRIGRGAYDLARAQEVSVLLIPDEEIARAQRALWLGLRQYVEPAGATALAALMSGAYVPAPGEKVAVLVCGANPADSPFPA